MTQDEIIELAKKYGVKDGTNVTFDLTHDGSLLRFTDKLILSSKAQLTPSQSVPIAKVVDNQAGQIYICDNQGNSFDISKYVGYEFYARPQPTSQDGYSPLPHSEGL